MQPTKPCSPTARSSSSAAAWGSPSGSVAKAREPVRIRRNDFMGDPVIELPGEGHALGAGQVLRVRRHRREHLDADAGLVHVRDAEFAVGGHHARPADPLRPPADVCRPILHCPDGPSLTLPLAHQRHHVLAPESGRPHPLEPEFVQGVRRLRQRVGARRARQRRRSYQSGKGRATNRGGPGGRQAHRWPVGSARDLPRPEPRRRPGPAYGLVLLGDPPSFDEDDTDPHCCVKPLDAVALPSRAATAACLIRHGPTASCSAPMASWLRCLSTVRPRCLSGHRDYLKRHDSPGFDAGRLLRPLVPRERSRGLAKPPPAVSDDHVARDRAHGASVSIRPRRPSSARKVRRPSRSTRSLTTVSPPRAGSRRARARAPPRSRGLHRRIASRLLLPNRHVSRAAGALESPRVARPAAAVGIRIIQSKSKRQKKSQLDIHTLHKKVYERRKSWQCSPVDRSVIRGRPSALPVRGGYLHSNSHYAREPTLRGSSGGRFGWDRVGMTEPCVPDGAIRDQSENCCSNIMPIVKHPRMLQGGQDSHPL